MNVAKESNDNEDLKIDAMPTKELFIEMLIKDILLIPAIIDLADNCADGAKKQKPDGKFDKFWARIKLKKDSFHLSDNCGGITVDTARKYAFRFGRPSKAPSVKHSVGQFGVGMKRAIFKMGSHFRVESSTSVSHFVVDVNVEKWATQKEWQFQFDELEEGISVKPDDVGTIIDVSVLHPDIAEKFTLKSFESELKAALQATLQDPISKGLNFTLNGVPINSEPLLLLSNKHLAPAEKELSYPEKGEKIVTVHLFCGLGASTDRDAAGWHVFCNGRLILEGDKSEVTGWGEDADNFSVPGFHGQFNHFRGYAYFECDDAKRLPWNTTKTGVDADSAIYRSVRLEMMKMMRPVVDFLNRLKEEKEGKEEEEVGPLEKMVNDSKAVELEDVKTREVFHIPVSHRVVAKPTHQKISYERPIDRVVEAKRVLKARSFKEVGERTFDYFYRAEIEE